MQGMPAILQRICGPGIVAINQEAKIKEILQRCDGTTKAEDQKATSPAPVNKYLPPCSVCSGVSTGVHFGVHTCEACKTFFRRCQTRKVVQPCKTEPLNTCAITATGKGKYTCTWCRYKKCLAVGMDKEGIRKGRYCYALKTQQTKDYQLKQSLAFEEEQLQSVDLEARLTNAYQTFQNTFPDTMGVFEEREELIDRISNHMKLIGAGKLPHYVVLPGKHGAGTATQQQANSTRTTEFIMNCPSLLEGDAESLKNLRNPAAIGALKTMWQLWLVELEAFFMCVTRYAKQIPGFSDLSMDDRMKLLIESRPEIILLLKYHGMDFDNGTSMTYRRKTDELGVAPLALISKGLLGKQLSEMMFSLVKRMQSLNLTAEDLSVYFIIVLICPDRDGLKQHEPVTKLQEDWIPVLQYSLRKNHSDYKKLFAELLLLLPEFRQLSHMNKTVLSNVTDVVKPELSPLIAEIFSDITKPSTSNQLTDEQASCSSQ